MRSAESRLGVVTSLDSAMRGAGRTWELLRVPRSAARWGLFACGSALGVLLLRRMLGSGRKAAVAAPAVAAPQSGALALVGRLLLQALPVLLTPLLKSQMRGGGAEGKWGSLLHPQRLFFRWVGLEK